MSSNSKYLELADLLQEKCNEENTVFTNNLNQSVNEIIDTLGGIHNVLQVCLQNNTDNYGKDNKYYINNEQIASLNKLLIETSTVPVTITSLATQRRNVHKDDILLIDASHNLFFKFFSVEKAQKYFYKYALSKHVVIYFLVLIVWCVIFDQLVKTNTLNASITVLSVMRGICYFVVTSFLLIPIFGLNIEIVRETSKTFDFVYKFVQIIVVMFCAGILWRSQDITIFRIICISIPWTILLLLICYIDALNLANSKWKMLVLFVGTIGLLVICATTYFQYDEVLWDPFNGLFGINTTNIAFKSLYLSSMLNFAIFTAKPLLSGIRSLIWDKKKMTKGLVKSTSLISRPYFNWTNTTLNEFQLSHSIQNSSNINDSVNP